mgnify:CR=1 FL=1
MIGDGDVLNLGWDVLTLGWDVLTLGGDVLTLGWDVLTLGGDVLTKMGAFLLGDVFTWGRFYFVLFVFSDAGKVKLQ